LSEFIAKHPEFSVTLPPASVAPINTSGNNHPPARESDLDRTGAPVFQLPPNLRLQQPLSTQDQVDQVAAVPRVHLTLPTVELYDPEAEYDATPSPQPTALAQLLSTPDSSTPIHGSYAPQAVDQHYNSDVFYTAVRTRDAPRITYHTDRGGGT
jgi:hypothetical protein